MDRFKMMVPTYHAEMAAKAGLTDNNDFGEPSVPVLICDAEGVRIVLGTHDYKDFSKPEVQIERRPNGWAIFLNPVAGGDTSGLVYFLDDGRSFLVPDGLPSEAIHVLDRSEDVPMIDDPSVCVPTPQPDLIVNAVPDSREGRSVVAKPLSTASGDVPASTALEHDAVRAKPRLAMCDKLVDAFAAAKSALVGDSTDDEHDALWGLVEALDQFELVEHFDYSPDWLIEDFIGWSGLDRDGVPDEEDIRVYVTEARPVDSCPLRVHSILDEWSIQISNASVHSYMRAPDKKETDRSRGKED